MSEHSASPTAERSYDELALGSSQGQRGAEILAGVRAEITPSNETRALAKFSARLVARMYMTIVRAPEIVNYPAVRSEVYRDLIQRRLDKRGAGSVVVEIAAGMSPRSILMAQEYPDVRFIEVDLPDVVKDKQQRLKRKIKVPENLEWFSADLGVTPLSEVLSGVEADIIVAEGLLSYFDHETIQSICKGVLDCLKPGGVFMADIAWQKGLDDAAKASRLFASQAGTSIGNVNSHEEAIDVFKEAGYENVQVYNPDEVAETIADDFDLPLPVHRFTLICAAQKSEK